MSDTVRTIALIKQMHIACPNVLVERRVIRPINQVLKGTFFAGETHGENDRFGGCSMESDSTAGCPRPVGRTISSDKSKVSAQQRPTNRIQAISRIQMRPCAETLENIRALASKYFLFVAYT